MSKAVVFVHGGKVQNVMVDDEKTEVIVIDTDIEDVPANEQITLTDSGDGEKFNATVASYPEDKWGIREIEVSDYFRQVEES